MVARDLVAQDRLICMLVVMGALVILGETADRNVC
jgi:hypothetical protein